MVTGEQSSQSGSENGGSKEKLDSLLVYTQYMYMYIHVHAHMHHLLQIMCLYVYTHTCTLIYNVYTFYIVHCIDHPIFYRKERDGDDVSLGRYYVMT